MMYLFDDTYSYSPLINSHQRQLEVVLKKTSRIKRLNKINSNIKQDRRSLILLFYIVQYLRNVLAAYSKQMERNIALHRSYIRLNRAYNKLSGHQFNPNEPEEQMAEYSIKNSCVEITDRERSMKFVFSFITGTMYLYNFLYIYANDCLF